MNAEENEMNLSTNGTDPEPSTEPYSMRLFNAVNCSDNPVNDRNQTEQVGTPQESHAVTPDVKVASPDNAAQELQAASLDAPVPPPQASPDNAAQQLKAASLDALAPPPLASPDNAGQQLEAASPHAVSPPSQASTETAILPPQLESETTTCKANLGSENILTRMELDPLVDVETIQSEILSETLPSEKSPNVSSPASSETDELSYSTESVPLVDVERMHRTLQHDVLKSADTDNPANPQKMDTNTPESEVLDDPKTHTQDPNKDESDLTTSPVKAFDDASTDTASVQDCAASTVDDQRPSLMENVGDADLDELDGWTKPLEEEIMSDPAKQDNEGSAPSTLDEIQSNEITSDGAFSVKIIDESKKTFDVGYQMVNAAMQKNQNSKITLDGSQGDLIMVDTVKQEVPENTQFTQAQGTSIDGFPATPTTMDCVTENLTPEKTVDQMLIDSIKQEPSTPVKALDEFEGDQKLKDSVKEETVTPDFSFDGSQIIVETELDTAAPDKKIDGLLVDEAMMNVVKEETVTPDGTRDGSAASGEEPLGFLAVVASVDAAELEKLTDVQKLDHPVEAVGEEDIIECLADRIPMEIVKEEPVTTETLAGCGGNELAMDVVKPDPTRAETLDGSGGKETTMDVVKEETVTSEKSLDGPLSDQMSVDSVKQETLIEKSSFGPVSDTKMDAVTQESVEPEKPSIGSVADQATMDVIKQETATPEETTDGSGADTATMGALKQDPATPEKTTDLSEAEPATKNAIKQETADKTAELSLANQATMDTDKMDVKVAGDKTEVPEVSKLSLNQLKKYYKWCNLGVISSKAILKAKEPGLVPQTEDPHPDCKLPFEEIKQISLLIQAKHPRNKFLVETFFGGKNPEEQLRLAMSSSNARHPDCQHTWEELKNMAAEVPKESSRLKFLVETFYNGNSPADILKIVLPIGPSAQPIKVSSPNKAHVEILDQFLSEPEINVDHMRKYYKWLNSGLSPSEALSKANDPDATPPSGLSDGKLSFAEVKQVSLLIPVKNKVRRRFFAETYFGGKGIVEQLQLAFSSLNKHRHSDCKRTWEELWHTCSELPKVTLKLKFMVGTYYEGKEIVDVLKAMVPNTVQPAEAEKQTKTKEDSEKEHMTDIPNSCSSSDIVDESPIPQLNVKQLKVYYLWRNSGLPHAEALVRCKQSGKLPSEDPHPDCKLSAEEVNAIARYLPSKYSRSMFQVQTLFGGKDPENELDVLLKRATPHPKCRHSWKELRKMSAELPDVASRLNFMCGAFYNGKDPVSLLKSLRLTCSSSDQKGALKRSILPTKNEESATELEISKLSVNNLKKFYKWRILGSSIEEALAKAKQPGLQVETTDPHPNCKLPWEEIKEISMLVPPKHPRSLFQTETYLGGKDVGEQLKRVMERKDLKRHPDCNYTWEELYGMSNGLSKESLQWKFVVQAFYEGKPPAALLQKMSSKADSAASSGDVHYVDGTSKKAVRFSDTVADPSESSDKVELQTVRKLSNAKLKLYYLWRNSRVDHENAFLKACNFEHYPSWGAAHPNCSKSMQELDKMSSALPSELKDRFIIHTYFGGKDPDSTLKYFLSIKPPNADSTVKPETAADAQLKKYEQLNLPTNVLETFLLWLNHGCSHEIALAKARAGESTPRVNPHPKCKNTKQELRDYSRVLNTINKSGEFLLSQKSDWWDRYVIYTYYGGLDPTATLKYFLSVKGQIDEDPSFTLIDEDSLNNEQLKIYYLWLNSGMAPQFALKKAKEVADSCNYSGDESHHPRCKIPHKLVKSMSKILQSNEELWDRFVLHTYYGGKDPLRTLACLLSKGHFGIPECNSALDRTPKFAPKPVEPVAKRTRSNSGMIPINSPDHPSKKLNIPQLKNYYLWVSQGVSPQDAMIMAKNPKLMPKQKFSRFLVPLRKLKILSEKLPQEWRELFITETYYGGSDPQFLLEDLLTKVATDSKQTPRQEPPPQQRPQQESSQQQPITPAQPSQGTDDPNAFSIDEATDSLGDGRLKFYYLHRNKGLCIEQAISNCQKLVPVRGTHMPHPSLKYTKEELERRAYTLPERLRQRFFTHTYFGGKDPEFTRKYLTVTLPPRVEPTPVQQVPPVQKPHPAQQHPPTAQPSPALQVPPVHYPPPGQKPFQQIPPLQQPSPVHQQPPVHQPPPPLQPLTLSQSSAPQQQENAVKESADAFVIDEITRTMQFAQLKDFYLFRNQGLSVEQAVLYVRNKMKVPGMPFANPNLKRTWEDLIRMSQALTSHKRDSFFAHTYYGGKDPEFTMKYLAGDPAQQMTHGFPSLIVHQPLGQPAQLAYPMDQVMAYQTAIQTMGFQPVQFVQPGLPIPYPQSQHVAAPVYPAPSSSSLPIAPSSFPPVQPSPVPPPALQETSSQKPQELLSAPSKTIQPLVGVHDPKLSSLKRKATDRLPIKINLKSSSNDSKQPKPSPEEGPSRTSPKPIHDDKPKPREKDLPSALDSSLPMFIVPSVYPDERLTEPQMDAIESSLLEAILEMDDDGTKPSFKDVNRNNGRYGITCIDQFSAIWLCKFLNTYKPWPGASLKLKSTGVKANAILPSSKGDDDKKILKFIERQNKGLNVSEWTVIQRWDNGDLNTCMELIIDDESAEILLKSSKINFKLGSAEIVTSKEGGLPTSRLEESCKKAGDTAGKSSKRACSPLPPPPKCIRTGEGFASLPKRSKADSTSSFSEKKCSKVDCPPGSSASRSPDRFGHPVSKPRVDDDEAQEHSWMEWFYSKEEKSASRTLLLKNSQPSERPPKSLKRGRHSASGSPTSGSTLADSRALPVHRPSDLKSLKYSPSSKSPSPEHSRSSRSSLPKGRCCESISPPPKYSHSSRSSLPKHSDSSSVSAEYSRSARSPPPKHRRVSKSPPLKLRCYSRSPSPVCRRSSRSPATRHRRSSRSPPTRLRRSSRSPPLMHRRSSRSPPTRHRCYSRSPPLMHRRYSKSPPPKVRSSSRSPPLKHRRSLRSPPPTHRRSTRSPAPAHRCSSRSPPPNVRSSSRSPPPSHRRPGKSVFTRLGGRTTPSPNRHCTRRKRELSSSPSSSSDECSSSRHWSGESRPKPSRYQ